MGKTCVSCGEEKTIEDFYTANHKTGPQAGMVRIYSSCKVCTSYQRRAKTYNSTIEKIKELLENAVCDICGSCGYEHKKGLHVDHCHTTGVIRGVLCHSCNTGLGAFKDDFSLIKKALEYLKCHEQR